LSPAVPEFRDSAAPRFGARETLRALSDGRWIIVVMVVICTLAAVVAVYALPPWFQSKVLLSAVTDQSSRAGLGSSVGSAVSQLSGVSKLAGLGLSASEAKAESVATLQSEALTERYISENNLLPVLYSRKWDANRQTWKSDDPEERPTLWKANRYFDKKVRLVETNGKTGLITLTIEWKDPNLAAQWANGLVKLTNEYMRAQAIAESDRNIAYLQDQAAKISVVELRAAIYQLMESEIKKEMIARGNDQYAFKVIDPAVVSEKKSFPEPVLWISAGCALGLAVGVGAALVRYALHGTKEHPEL
jgi:uncharacterized protein involved in exopolysaccharide biosynthesis